MKKYQIRIPPEVEIYIRHLHPKIKKKIRNALDEIEQNPFLGKALEKQLAGLHSYRVSKFRIIYEIVEREIIVNVVDVDKRKVIYQKVLSLMRSL